ncbi:Protein glass, partial [Stegodyphus mimosarum]
MLVEHAIKPGLISHLRTHSTERPYVCDVCKGSFRRKQSLTEHLKIHSNEYMYQCTVCSKKYRRKTELRKHFCTGYMDQ